MSNVIELSNFNTNNSNRFFLKVISLQVNDELRDFVYIMHEGHNIIPTISIYSKYFEAKVLDYSLVHKSTNTIVNTHAKFIVLFLNYIFYESDNKIDKIQDLDYELVKQFLRKHARGELSSQKGNWINKYSANKCGRAIMMFVYWLKTARLNNGRILGLNKISKDDFTISIKKKKIKNSSNTSSQRYTFEKEYKHIESPPDVELSSSHKYREKSVELTLYGVKLLLDLSNKYVPNITFAIVLGAFVGLRQGEVVQMHRGRIGELGDISTSIISGAKIDLLQKVPLCHNPKDMGDIKKERLQPIYEPFMPIISTAYNNHMNMLRSKGLNTHLYGALFFNNRNGVMKQRTFCKQFKMLTDKFIEVIREEALNHNIYAMKEYSLLENCGFNITFHSLRYFYTHMLETLEANPFQVMYYRGDKAIESQNTYRSNITTIAGVRKVMDAMESELKKYGFKEIIEGLEGAIYD